MRCLQVYFHPIALRREAIHCAWMERILMGVGFISSPGKNHPGITPFGYCLVLLWSATLFRDTSVTHRPAMSTMGRMFNVFDRTYDDTMYALIQAEPSAITFHLGKDVVGGLKKPMEVLT